MTIIGFFIAAGFSVSLPFLSLYFYLQRGIPMTVVGGIILVSGICSAVAQMFGGVFADWLGRRPLMIGGAGVSVLLYGSMAFLIATSAPVIAMWYCHLGDNLFASFRCCHRFPALVR